MYNFQMGINFGVLYGMSFTLCLMMLYGIYRRSRSEDEEKRSGAIKTLMVIQKLESGVMNK